MELIFWAKLLILPINSFKYICLKNISIKDLLPETSQFKINIG